MNDTSSISSIPESPPAGSPAGAGLSRRSVVTAGVFAVPAVTLLSQSPALANSVLPQVAIEAAGGVIPATGPVAITVTVRSRAGALLPGQVVSLTGPPDSNFASSDGTTDGSGRFTTTFWLAKPWITPGTTVTITAVSTGTSASQAFTVVGSNVLATGPNTWGQLGNGAPGGGWTTPAQTLPVFSSPVVQVASGEQHTVALLANGTVWTVGNPANGRLGRDTSAVPYTQFGQVPGLSGVTQIAAQWNGGYALVSGRVYAWGWNTWGQVGDGTTVDRDRPTLVSGLSDVTYLAAGRVNGLVILADKTVRAWGAANESGQVGNGSTTDQLAPVTVTGLSDIVQVAGGADTHSALRVDGTVWAWGANDRGQVGDGTTITRLTPSQVLQVQQMPYSSIARGGDTGYAIRADDKAVVAWGSNSSGQVGVGATGTPFEIRPLLVQGMTNTVLFGAGVSSAYAKKADSTVFAWGGNANGRLGTGDTNDRNTPTPVAGLSGRFISAISSGASMTAAYFAAEAATVSVDVGAQVTAGAVSAVIASVVSPSSAVVNTPLVLSASGNAVLGATSGTTDGAGIFRTTVTPNAWTRPGAVLRVTASCDAGTASDTSTVLGANLLRLGQGGTRASAPSPVQDDRVFPHPVTRVTMSHNGAAVILADGSVWTRGAGNLLGDGSTAARDAWGPVPSLSNVVDLCMGYTHVVALTDNGEIWAWGDNSRGQLGLRDDRRGQLGEGDQVSVSLPTKVPYLSGFAGVSTGRMVTFAWKSDGSVWSTGWNSNFQLGTTGGDRTSFAKIEGLDNVERVSGGFLMGGLALKKDGTVWAWGGNAQGQLCDGTTTDRATPTQIPGLSGVKKVQGGCSDGYGETSGYALTSAGALWSWGVNTYGQLGDGSKVTRTAPVKVGDGYVDVAASTKAVYALKSDRTTLAASGLTAISTIGDVTTPGTIDLGRPVVDLSEQTYVAYANQQVYAITADATVSVDVDAQVSAGSAGVVQVAVASSSAPVPNTSLTLSATGGVVLGSASGSTSAAGGYQTTVTPDSWTTPGSVLRVTAKSDLGSGSDTYTVLGANVLHAGYSLWAAGGDGTWDDHLVATQSLRQFPSPVVQVYTGFIFAVALLADGSVWSVGRNDYGQLGDPSIPVYDGGASSGPAMQGRSTWGRVPGLPSNIVQISGGRSTVYARTAGGDVYAWGWNGDGQVGNGSSVDQIGALKVSGLTGVKKICGAYRSAFAIMADDSVVAWGGNGSGSLGLGYASPRELTRIAVPAWGSVSDIGGDNQQTVALRTDGTVWTSSSTSGTLGNGTSATSASPVRVASLSNVSALGFGFGFFHALRSDATVVGWGANDAAQLGITYASPPVLSPTPLSGLAGVSQIANGHGGGYALLGNGQVWGWGQNSRGELADGTTALGKAPVQMTGTDGRTVVRVDAGISASGCYVVTS